MLDKVKTLRASETSKIKYVHYTLSKNLIFYLVGDYTSVAPR